MMTLALFLLSLSFCVNFSFIFGEVFYCPKGDFVCYRYHPYTKEVEAYHCTRYDHHPSQRIMECEENLRCMTDLKQACTPYQLPFNLRQAPGAYKRFDGGLPFKPFGKGVRPLSNLLPAMGTGLGSMRQFSNMDQSVNNLGEEFWTNIQPIWEFDTE